MQTVAAKTSPHKMDFLTKNKPKNLDPSFDGLRFWKCFGREIQLNYTRLIYLFAVICGGWGCGGGGKFVSFNHIALKMAKTT